MKRIIQMVLMICMLCVAGGCSNAPDVEEEKDRRIEIYYLNRSETAIRSEKYEIVATDTGSAVEEVLGRMKQTPDKAELKASPFADISILSIRLEETRLTLNLEAKYNELPYTTAVLVRAAIVKTLTQINGVNYVSFEIDGAPLLDASGKAVGLLNGEQFVDNPEGQISNNASAVLQLYYANADGTGLVPVQRYVEYNTNVSLEKLVTELLIQGPAAGEEAYPVMNPNTKILSVIVKDNTCYLNLDESFLTQVYSVNSDVTVYAIANSLIALNNVNKVQISVNGNSDVTYRESISLTTYFERNLDLVVTEETEE